MPKKLLVADDSITIQKVVGLTFAGEDVAIECVPNGNLAIERVKELRPDIVLADVFMPGRNGYEVCAAIKDDPELSKIPVVLLVGTFEPFNESEASRVKCDYYLTKPFDTSELLRVVHSLTGGEMGMIPPEAPPEEPVFEESPGDISQEAKPANSVFDPVRRQPLPPPIPRLVSARTRESFLGSHRVLDLFDPERGILGFAPVPVCSPISATNSVAGAARAASAEPMPALGAPGVEISEETLNIIVERVVKRMSDDVVREVAWEVVPELSEIVIRQCLDGKGKI
jgi:CheY-like chemotaxis protein